MSLIKIISCYGNIVDFLDLGYQRKSFIHTKMMVLNECENGQHHVKKLLFMIRIYTNELFSLGRPYDYIKYHRR